MPLASATRIFARISPLTLRESRSVNNTDLFGSTAIAPKVMASTASVASATPSSATLFEAYAAVR